MFALGFRFLVPALNVMLAVAVVIALYLAATTGANLLIATLGPLATIPVAFCMIAATLCLRDVLHDRWQGRSLSFRMALLILTGSALSYLLNQGAENIAKASFLAFAIAESADALVYQRFLHLSWMRRANLSNVASALLDSMVFPLVAFGAFLPHIVAGQFLAKVLGGVLWSFAISAFRRRDAFQNLQTEPLGQTSG